MLKPLTLLAVAVAGALLATAAQAADGPRAHRRAAAHAAPHLLYCGCCGCLYGAYDYHRQLVATYGPRFDPRSFDQTEPIYHYSRVRAYPRYWTEPPPVVTPH
jgi:hypothetical protein